MTDLVRMALIGGGSAIVGGAVGGLLSGVYQHTRDHRGRPVLSVDYAGNNANSDPVEYKVGDAIISEIFVRVRVRNLGRRVAKRCRVYLSALHEVQPSRIIPTTLYDAKPLPWAGHHFAPRDVPRGVEFYVDVIRISKQKPGWDFCVNEIFASQMGIRGYSGTYRLRLLITADNAEPAICELDATYTQEWGTLRAGPANAAL